MLSIGDRMKQYYETPSAQYLTRRVPVIVRVDGRAFHTFCRGMKKPFDTMFMEDMRWAAAHVAADMQGCKLAYVQSDEASFLLTDFDDLTTDAWFGYRAAKVVSAAASLMTAYFILAREYKLGNSPPTFDARAFNVPQADVANYFLWRAQDWERNSLEMYCRAFFSHKQMHGKNRAAQHEMLHSVGKNWTTDLSDAVKNGSWLLAPHDWHSDIRPVYSEIATIVYAVMPTAQEA